MICMALYGTAMETQLCHKLLFPLHGMNQIGELTNVNIIFLIDEERWCLLLLKCSHSHRSHSATIISLEKLLLGGGYLLLSHCRVSEAPAQAQGE